MNIEEFVTWLSVNKIKIATAESCTGGLIAQRITSVSGASMVFDCGIVAYSNEIKKSVLGVKVETLNKYGAVSEQTACEMAQGVRSLSGADVAVSVTGIAGPDGGSTEKPVGTVYIGISTVNGTEAKRYLFKGNREEIRNQTAETALELVFNRYNT